MDLRVILMAMIILSLIFIGGCTPQTSLQNECSALDGTWKGVISNSGVIKSEKTHDIMEEPVRAPFIAQYDFEMTIKADTEGGYYGEDHVCSYKITYVKASHPLFNCQQGCTPVQVAGENTFASWMSTNKEGYGIMHIGFSNGASIPAFTEDNRLRAIPQENKIELYIPENVENWETIGIRTNPDYKTMYDANAFWVETDNCYKMGNVFCYVESLNKNTIILNRIS